MYDKTMIFNARC